MPSPLAHSIAGYLLAKLFPQKYPRHGCQKLNIQILYPIFVANVADLDFIPQLILNEPVHRGLTHSIVFAIGFSIVAGCLVSYIWRLTYKQVFIFTFLLYGSHILMDLLTEGRGVRLLLPFSNNFVQSPVIVFLGLHHSRGLWNTSHLLTIGYELFLSVIVFWLISCWQRARHRKGAGANP